MEFRIVDFNVFNELIQEESELESNTYEDRAEFKIQIFGINEFSKTFSVLVNGFKPFFYILVQSNWTEVVKSRFLEHIKKQIGPYYKNSITECSFVNRKKLYGFDGGKVHKFIKMEFKNTNAFNKVKNLWYTVYKKGQDRHLLKDGFIFEKTKTMNV